MIADLFGFEPTPEPIPAPLPAAPVLPSAIAPPAVADPLRCACGAWGHWGFTGSTLAGTAGPRFCHACAVADGRLEPRP